LRLHRTSWRSSDDSKKQQEVSTAVFLMSRARIHLRVLIRILYTTVGNSQLWSVAVSNHLLQDCCKFSASAFGVVEMEKSRYRGRCSRSYFQTRRNEMEKRGSV
jgi:hypothetical protein